MLAANHDCDPKGLYEAAIGLSRFATKTLQKLDNVPQGFKDELAKTQATYIKGVNRQMVEEANTLLKANEGKLGRDVNTAFDSTTTKPPTAQDVANATVLIQRYNSRGEYEAAAFTALKVSQSLTKAGQVVQAAAIMGRLTPEGQLKLAANVVKNSNDSNPKRDVNTIANAEEEAKDVGRAIGKITESVIDDVVNEALTKLEKAPAKPAKPKRETAGQRQKKERLETDLENAEGVVVQQEKKVRALKLKLKTIDEAKVAQDDAKRRAKELEKAQIKEALAAQNKKLQDAASKVKQLKLQLKAVTDPEGQLAVRIQGYVKPKGVKVKLPIQVMVDTLFKVAKETPLTKGASPDTPKQTPLDILKAAIQNRDDYKDVYFKAKALVEAKFISDPEATKAVKAFMDDAFNQPYSKSQLNKAVDTFLKQEKTDLRTLVKQHYLQANHGLKALEQKLAAQTNLAPEQIKGLVKDIARRLDERVGEAKRIELDRQLKKRVVSPSVRKTLVERMVQLSNLGAFNDDAYVQAIAERLGVARLSDEAKAKIVTLSSELQNTLGKNQRAVLQGMLQREISDLKPVSFGQKLQTLETVMMLSGTPGRIRDVVSSVSWQAVAQARRNFFSVPIDIAAKAIFGGERTTTFTNPRVWWSGAKLGVQEVIRDYKLDIDTFNVAATFDTKPTRVFKAQPLLPNTWKNAGENAKIGLNNGLAFLEKAVGASLRLVDRTIYEATYRSSLFEQAQAAKLNGKPLRLTEPMIENAKLEALVATFQDDSMAARAMQKIKKGLNVVGFENGWGLGDLILKFPKTPANLLMSAVRYSPLEAINTAGMIATSIRRGEPINRRKVAESIGSTLTGSIGGMSTGALLGSLGLMTAGYGLEDRDIETTRLQKGIPPYAINLTGVSRWVLSGFDSAQAKPQVGDVTAKYDWVQPVAGLYAAGVTLNQKYNQKGGDSLDAATSATRAALESLLEAPMLQGVSTLFKTRNEDGKINPVAGFVKLVEGVPGRFVPGPIRQLESAISNTAKDTDGGNPLINGLNMVYGKIPFVSDALPVRQTQYGDVLKKSEVVNPWLSAFFSPGAVYQVKNDPVADEVLRLYRDTGETRQAIAAIPRKVALVLEPGGGKVSTKLTAQQRAAYGKYTGKLSRVLLGKLIETPGYQRAADEGKGGKVAQVAQLLADVRSAGRIRILGHRPKVKGRISALVRATSKENTPWLY